MQGLLYLDGMINVVSPRESINLAYEGSHVLFDN